MFFHWYVYPARLLGLSVVRQFDENVLVVTEMFVEKRGDVDATELFDVFGEHVVRVETDLAEVPDRVEVEFQVHFGSILQRFLPTDPFESAQTPTLSVRTNIIGTHIAIHQLTETIDEQWTCRMAIVGLVHEVHVERSSISLRDGVRDQMIVAQTTVEFQAKAHSFRFLVVRLHGIETQLFGDDRLSYFTDFSDVVVRISVEDLLLPVVPVFDPGMCGITSVFQTIVINVVFLQKGQRDVLDDSCVRSYLKGTMPSLGFNQSNNS